MAGPRPPWLITLMSGLFPPAFRRRFGPEMASAFAAEHHEARLAGVRATIRFWIRSLVGLLTGAAVEWVAVIRRYFLRRPSRRRQPNRERTMTFLTDLRLAVRSLARCPGLVAAAVATLALGVGANTAVFSVANGIMWKPFAYERPDQLVAIWPSQALSTREALFFREHSRTLADIATIAGWRVALTDVPSPTQVLGARTSDNVFRILGVQPVLGRDFAPSDVAPGAAPVVMLSDAFWRSTFGADTSLVGRSITIDGERHEVVGVMPPSFEILDPRTVVWIPLPQDPSDWTWNSGISQAVARVAPGQTVGSANAEFAELLAAYRGEYRMPDSYGTGATILSLKEQLVGSYRPTFLVLLGAVGFILLIAGANLSGLLLARAVDRHREMAVRAALGATRGRLAQTVLAESTVLSALGAAAGLVIAFGGVSFIKGLVPASTPRISQVVVDLPVLAACLGFAAIAGLAFSLVPALVTAGHERQRDVTSTRSDAAAISQHRWQHAFLVGQVALAVALVVGAGLMIRTTRGLAAVDPGFISEGVLTLRIQPSGASYATPAQYRAFYRELAGRLEALPFVERVGGIQHLPMSGFEWGTDIEIEERPVPEGQAKPSVGYRIVFGDYFGSVGIPLIAGRTFQPTDRTSAPQVGIVNRAFVDRFFPGESAVGKRVIQGRNNPVPFTIVGVVENVRHRALDRDPIPDVYRPLEQSTMPAMMLAIRTDGPPTRYANLVQDEIWSMDANLPISRVEPLSTIVSDSLGRFRLVMVMLTLLALVALGLGAIGVYGVTAFTVSRRTGEFGIRMALGANPARVRREVLRLGLGRAAAGIFLGLIGAFFLNGSLEGLVYGVSTTDPATYVAVAGFMLIVAAAASWLPAWRATRIDPASALRA